MCEHAEHVNGFRKFFKTTAEQSGMLPANVEKLMGHSIGVSDSYYRPTEQDLREDYLKAVDKLTVLTSPQHQEIVKLSESNQALVLQMESRNQEIAELRDQVEEIRYMYEDLIKRNIVVRNMTHDGRITSVTDGYNRPLA